MRFFSNHTTWSRPGRAGLTLIELLVSVAIFAVLTAIIFTNLSREKTRSALKQAADVLQADLQGMQNRTQSGVVAPGASTLPGGNGLQLQTTAPNTQYTLFADMLAGSPPSSDRRWDAAVIDRLILTRLLSTNIVVQALQTNLGATTRVDIVFAGFKGDASIRTNAGTFADSGTIILKNTQLNVCYAVGIQRVGGVVTKKQLTSC